MKNKPLPKGITTVTPGTRFKTTGYAEKWRGVVADELNILMQVAADYSKLPEKEAKAVAETLRSVVRRVAEFEDIKTKKGEKVV
jgi:hypothetical protein